MKFIESICYGEKAYHNLRAHQERVNRTFEHFFDERPFELSQILPPIDEDQTMKVRVVYDDETLDVEYAAYVKRKIESLQVVEVPSFDYSFKYEDRSILNKLFQSSNADDIIISVDGFLTDSSYSNLALYDGSEWVTPSHPLLEGTKRRRLIEEGKIKTAPIRTSELAAFEKISLINAMLDLEDLVIPISAVRLPS